MPWNSKMLAWPEARRLAYTKRIHANVDSSSMGPHAHYMY